MKKLLVLSATLFLGYLLGSLAPAAQASIHVHAPIHAARIIGSDGTLENWTIEDSDGNELCSDPYAWTSTSTLECDTDSE